VQWIGANHSLPNFGFDSLPGSVKNDIKNSLLAEQGYICAYTGLRISDSRSHIEHLIPQRTCRAQGNLALTVDYSNVVACYPGNGNVNPGFGAIEKDGWPDVTEVPQFLKPTDPSSEKRITYTSTGNAMPAPHDSAASCTVEKLKLNHKSLVTRRKEAIQGIFTELKGKTCNRGFLEKRIRSLNTAINGKYEEFSFAKKSYLEKKLMSS
jgi:uncharacterized protein (TIGR02646 family)